MIKIALLLALVVTSLALLPLQILYVSSSPSSIVRPVYSSLRGGRFIYIKAIGHSPVASDNIVTVGDIPCNIPSDGVTDTFISCETGDSGLTTDSGSLSVYLISMGRVTSVSWPNSVYYQNWYTPMLNDIFPTAGFASTSVNLYGTHRISNVGDGGRDLGEIVRLRLGSDICSTFDINQAAITSYSLQSINCKQSSSQEAGRYNVTEQVVPGYAAHSYYLRRASLNKNDNFEFTALPTITSVSPAAGNLGGQYLSIDGTGFSLTTANNSVSVDGTPCEVTSSSETHLECTLAPKDTSKTAKFTTTSSSQVLGYPSGAGLEYARYDLSSSATVASFRTAIKANNATFLGTPKEVGIRADLREFNYYGDYYGQFWKGYFTAAVSGPHTFRGFADDTFSLYLATVPGSAELPATPLIYSDSYQYGASFFVSDTASAEATVTLDAGKSYYLEAYHLNGYGSGHFRATVDVPNTDATLPFQTHQIDKLVINSTIQPEVVTYSMVGGTTGIIKLRIYRSDATGVTYDKSVNVTYGCTAEQFATAVSNFDSFSGFKATVTRTIYDASNATLATLTGAARVDYVVSFLLMRSTAFQTENFILTYYNYTGVFQVASRVDHSPLIEGTFTLTVGGASIITNSNASITTIPFDVTGDALQAGFRKIVGFEKVEVERYSQDGVGYASTWIIRYREYNGAVPTLVLNGAALTGGVTTPTIVATTRRAYSTNIAFEPIDYRFLSMAAPSVNVLASVNGIPSVCTGNCAYAFNDWVQISALSVSGSTLSLGLVDVATKNFVLSSVSVKVGGLPCSTLTGTIAAFTCSLQINTDNSPILVAGSVTPVISVSPLGIASLASGVLPLTVALRTDSLSITTGGDNGGYTVNILGSGFPLDAKKATVTVCGNKATIKTITNKIITIYMPSCNTLGAQNVNVDLGGGVANSSLSFTYTNATNIAPTIISLLPTSANPGIKGSLEINGNGFGTNLSAINVFLSNATGKVYSLNVLAANNTYVKVGLPGGESGVFTLQVNLPTTGDSISASANANRFEYAVEITSISPTTGSYNGGTLITITGRNFATEPQQTLAFVGDELNWFCNIETITATSIGCRTPAISQYYAPGVGQRVVVSTRLIVLSTCTGTCNFTYLNEAASPSLTSLSATSGGVQDVTLTGTLFTSAAACEVSLKHVISGEVTVLTASSCSATTAVVTIPASVLAGDYDMRVRSTIGESNPLSYSVNWYQGVANYSSGGPTAGAVIKFAGGSGFPATFDNPAFSIVVSTTNNTYPTKLISCCANNEVVLEMPAAPNGTVFTISWVGPNKPNPNTYTAKTSLTTTVAVTSPTTVPPGANTITLNRTTLPNNAITHIDMVSAVDPSVIVPVPTFTTTVNITTFTVTLNAGPYNVRAAATTGYFYCAEVINVQAPQNIVNASQTASFAGGLFTLTANYLSPTSYITVNGFRGKLVSYSSTAATYNVPPLITSVSQTALKLAEVSLLDMGVISYSSDQTGTASAATNNVSYAFDGKINTIYGSANLDCWIGMDVGAGLQASVSRIRFFPYLAWANAANYTLDAEFQGSNDPANQAGWTTLGKIDQTVHSGWNTILSKSSAPFRYIRFVHTNASQCNLAEIELYGIVFSSATSSLTSTPSDVIYSDGFNTITFPAALDYTQTGTPVVDTVTPPYGDIFGNYPITITGSNLAGTAVVLIDGIACTNPTATATQITCTVGARPNLPTSNTFTVTVGGRKAILRDSFLYVLKWSDSRTWGVDQPPIAGDLVFVPQGMTLLVDQDTPQLEGIAVENGTLLFSNDTDVTVRAGFITLVGGRFIAGTERKPLTRKLTFIMYGGYYGKQLPMHGNKGIGCMECKFSMYGAPRTPTWTSISATVLPGDTTLTVGEDIDWKAGEEIVLASTSFFHEEAERRTILSVSGRTITVDKAYVYKHVSVSETHTVGGVTDNLQMRAEVGLLTRNIKMMGDESSIAKKYGSHLMISGKAVNGAEGHIAYTEFTNCGQPQILGRYCIHFHMNGEVPTSYVRGNAVHDSFARVVTLHGVHFLTVELNVGHRVRGHNFFVEDGIETKNIIRNNLAVSSLQVTNMLQTDTSVASFWITNPTNDFYGNHAAGSDFYGIWYEIKPNPDGPSATNDVCPIGNPLGNVANNVAHSNLRFGLRLFHLYSRKYPCQDVRDDTNATDPWYSNPSSPSIFSNFTLYKNLESGVLAEQTGNVIFRNFTVAENYHSGFDFLVANFTKEPPTVQNSAIIGKSQTNVAADPTNYTLGMSALITPRSGTTKFTDIRFYNFPAGSILLQTCRLCDDPLKFTNTGTEVIVEKLKFFGISGNYLFMIGLKRDVIYDLDASFSSAFGGLASTGAARTSATIVSNWSHISTSNQNTCPQAASAAKWDYAVMCDQTITIRRVAFTNLLNKQLFMHQHLKAAEISTMDELVDPKTDPALYSQIGYMVGGMDAKKEKPTTWALPFITGRIYNIWWGSGIDFSHLAITSSSTFTPSDKGIIFKFNYSENREFYNVGPMRGGKLLTKLSYIPETKDYLNPLNCSNGDHYHNNDNSSLRMFTVCQSGKGRTFLEYTEVNGIICEFLCPAPAGTFIKEPFVRVWSNASQWPNNTVPAPGKDVYVNGNWTVLLDVDPFPAGFMVIDGTVFADDTRDVNITAKSIHIRAGNVTAGSASNPFIHKFTIQVNGLKTEVGQPIDPVLSANKFLVVTGSLNLFGTAPGTVSTFLSQSAAAGTTTLNVGASSDWAVGDTLVISPSYSKATEYEKVTISAINSDGSIEISPALQYGHYGSSSLTITSPTSTVGSLDARTRVGHVSRNIKFESGPDLGWGYTVIVFGFLDGAIRRVGSAQLSGVQFNNGGQYDTLNSALVFKNVQNGNESSSVSASSFLNCKAFCINVDSSDDISINNNVFYIPFVFGLQAAKMTKFTFTNNLIIGVSPRPSVPVGGELIACVSILEYVDPATSQVSVKNNFCQGSEGHGFAFPHIKCSEFETNPFANNTVGSAFIGFIFNTISQQCQAFSYAKAYACSIGNICGAPSSTDLMFSNFVMADNKRSITLKLGASEGKTNHSGFLYNSYVTAVSRPNCLECYGPSATVCSDTHGIRMLTVSANGEVMPKKYGGGFDVICKQPVYDNKVFIYNVTFDNFRQVYNGTNMSGICARNFAFRPHSLAGDSVSGHNLFNSPCLNCDTSSYLLANLPDESHLGWFGGCGDMVCTGFLNYLIQDHTGTFLGFKGVVMPNNSAIGENEAGCVYKPSMKSFVCQREDFATLEYENIAADFNTRIMWPVSLTYDGSPYTTRTNGWRDWEWIGKEPQNKRFGRFMSIVRLNQVYNMTFAAMPPTDMQLQIQKRTTQGSNLSYVLVKLHYPMPNSIRVQVNGKTMKPVLLTDVNATTMGLQRQLNRTVCGDNAYFFDNYTVHFVVTEEADCVVRVSVTESIQLTTHFAMDINDFFSDSSKQTNFINNLCALLNIQDTSRVKIVGVKSGSTTITAVIDPATTPPASTTTTTTPTTPSTDSSQTAVAAALGSSIASGTFSSALGASVGPVIGATSVYQPLTTTTTLTEEEKLNIGLIVGVSIAGIIIFVGVIVTVMYCIRKRAKVVEEIHSSEDEPHQNEKEGKPSIELMDHSSHVPHYSNFKIHDKELEVKNIEDANGLDY